MRRNTLALLILILSPVLGIPAQDFDGDIHYTLYFADSPAAPQILSGQMIFLYQGDSLTQGAGVSFAHEDYRRIHPFQKNPQGLFVLNLPLPSFSGEIYYRFVVDGVWTTDPQAEKRYDDQGIAVSVFPLPIAKMMPSGINQLENRRYRFVLRDLPGKKVSLAGNFNRWDPYLTWMRESETTPGLYSVVVNIPREEVIYYRYLVDGSPTLDPAHGNTARNTWGEEVSFFTP